MGGVRHEPLDDDAVGRSRVARYDYATACDPHARAVDEQPVTVAQQWLHRMAADRDAREPPRDRGGEQKCERRPEHEPEAAPRREIRVVGQARASDAACPELEDGSAAPADPAPTG